jgi:hypothetical protein
MVLYQICVFGADLKFNMAASHGDHLEFSIGKRFTNLVQDHPMILPAKSQFNWLGGF